MVTSAEREECVFAVINQVVYTFSLFVFIFRVNRRICLVFVGVPPACVSRLREAPLHFYAEIAHCGFLKVPPRT